MKINILLFGFILLVNYGCNKSDKFEPVGMWQSLNGYTVLEFTNENIDLFKNGEPFWSIATENGKLNYTLKYQDENWYQLIIKDGEKNFVKCKIEVVNTDRIRVYYFKHHNILDLADEYQRTDDFNSFDQIMKEIMKEPEIALLN